MTNITEVEIIEFSFKARNIGRSAENARAIYNIGYKPNSELELTKFALIIRSDDGAEGQYVMHWGGTRATMAQTLSLAPNILGRNPDHREEIWSEMKRELRQHDGMGIGPIDICLWDLAGKRYGTSVSALLGGYRSRLKAYASTYHGDRNGRLDSPEAFADFAEYCYEIGYRAYKVHGWHDGDAREEARNVLHVAKKVGDRMTLMLDPACELAMHSMSGAPAMRPITSGTRTRCGIAASRPLLIRSCARCLRRLFCRPSICAASRPKPIS